MPSTHNLYLNVNPADAGEVSGANAYETGEVVSIMAVANSGWVFVAWTGGEDYVDNAAAANTTVIMPARNLTLTANFEPEGTGWPRDTETQIVDVTNPTTGKTWMDRNLGASRAAISSTDAEAYGDLYQWGRSADGHQKRTSETTYTHSISDTPGHGDFIMALDWRNPENINLWQGVNGINNPCPMGYRVPTEAELNAERASWSSNSIAGAYGSPLKLPAAGGRFYSDGSLMSVGSYGYYYSSNVDDTWSRGLYFHGSGAAIGTYYRAGGNSVRCLKE